MRQIYVNRHGVVVTEEEARDEKGLLRDGMRIRVPVTLMDGAPKLFFMDSAPDAQRDRLLSAYEKRDARLVDAWRDPAPAAKTADSAPPSDPIAAYERRDQRLRDAWRMSA